MHLEYFKIFSDLVAKRSFSEAAKLNGITQSAVSQQIKTMEDQNLISVEFKNKPYSRDIAIIHRKGKILTPSVKKFIEQVRI